MTYYELEEEAGRAAAEAGADRDHSESELEQWKEDWLSARLDQLLPSDLRRAELDNEITPGFAVELAGLRRKVQAREEADKQALKHWETVPRPYPASWDQEG